METKRADLKQKRDEIYKKQQYNAPQTDYAQGTYNQGGYGTSQEDYNKQWGNATEQNYGTMGYQDSQAQSYPGQGYSTRPPYQEAPYRAPGPGGRGMNRPEMAGPRGQSFRPPPGRGQQWGTPDFRAPGANDPTRFRGPRPPYGQQGRFDAGPRGRFPVPNSYESHQDNYWDESFNSRGPPPYKTRPPMDMQSGGHGPIGPQSSNYQSSNQNSDVSRKGRFGFDPKVYEDPNKLVKGKPTQNLKAPPPRVNKVGLKFLETTSI